MVTTSRLHLEENSVELPWARANTEALCRSYNQEGYVILRGLMPATLCDRAQVAFERDVKPYTAPLYRWSTYPERHVFDEHGTMMNALIDVHSLSQETFSDFKTSILAILTHPHLHEVLRWLVGEDVILAQTMYFEGNQGTPAHQDSYYLDSTMRGRLVGVWVAIEDIAPEAERFYICPRSHTLVLPSNSRRYDVAFHHDAYKTHVEKIVETSNLDRWAPMMRKGDVILWKADTIHGSHRASDPRARRSSMTGHFIPASTGLLHLQKIEKTLNVRRVGGALVHFPKDQDKLIPRLRYSLETHFPRLSSLLKCLVLKAILK